MFGQIFAKLLLPGKYLFGQIFPHMVVTWRIFVWPNICKYGGYLFCGYLANIYLAKYLQIWWLLANMRLAKYLEIWWLLENIRLAKYLQIWWLPGTRPGLF